MQDVLLGGRRGGGCCGNHDPDQCQRDPQDDREEARPHMKERAEIVVAGLQDDTDADQGHQPAGIVVALLRENV